ncbi:MAG: hypothetical protein AAGJ79_03180 [Verrucomicrobiota bacterium]
MPDSPAVSDPRVALAPLLQRVAALRKRLAFWLTLQGLAWVFGVALAVFLADFVIDRFFHMDLAQRTIMLGLMGSAIAWTAWKKLLRPLSTEISDDALVVKLEDSLSREDRETILSALELGRMDWSRRPEVSPALVESAIRKGAAAGGRIPVESVLREDRMTGNFLVSAFLGLVLFAIFLSSLIQPGSTAGIWVQRNILLADRSWPQDHEFEIEGLADGILRVPKGDDWTLTARVKKGAFSLPQATRLEIDRDGARRIEGMTNLGDDREFTAYIPPVNSPFTFRLLTNKVTSPWFNLEVVHRPRLDSLELVAVPPDYTGIEPQLLSVGSGPYRILAGSQLRVTGSADVPLASALLQIPDKAIALGIDESGTGFAGGAPPSALQSGSFLVDVASVEQIQFPGEVSPRGLGLRDPVRFRVKVIPDKPPTIQARIVGLSGLATPSAQVPLSAALRDDYGLSSARLAYDVKKDADGAEEESGIVELPLKAGTKEAEINESISLEDLGVETGSRLSMQVEASDNDAIAGTKSGTSTRLLLRIVTESELRADFLRREKEQQQVLTELIEKQDLLATDVRAFSAETRNVPQLDPSARSRLSGFEKQQGRIAVQVAAVIGQIERIVGEIAINRMPDEQNSLATRLTERVVTPLAEIRDQLSPEASSFLDLTRVPDTPPGDRTQFLSDAALAEAKVIGKLKQTLRHLVKNEDFQQAVNMLYDLQKSQENVLERTEDEKKKRVEELLKKDDEEPES